MIFGSHFIVFGSHFIVFRSLYIKLARNILKYKNDVGETNKKFKNLFCHQSEVMFLFVSSIFFIFNIIIASLIYLDQNTINNDLNQRLLYLDHILLYLDHILLYLDHYILNLLVIY